MLGISVICEVADRLGEILLFKLFRPGLLPWGDIVVQTIHHTYNLDWLFLEAPDILRLPFLVLEVILG